MAQEYEGICDNCREETTVYLVDEGTSLCEDCLADLDYIECDCCHEFWAWDAVPFYNLKDGRTLCSNCYENLLEDGELQQSDIESISDFT